jgi:hypothetical protein
MVVITPAFPCTAVFLAGVVGLLPDLRMYEYTEHSVCMYVYVYVFMRGRSSRAIVVIKAVRISQGTTP